MSTDPLAKEYPWYTPYQFAGNKPIWCIDLDELEDIPATGSNYPQPFSTEQLIHWATNDLFYKGPQSRGETVLLIQDYRVIENITNRVVDVHKEIVLFQGDLNKPIAKILQGNVTFAENGNMGPGRRPHINGGGTIQFDTPEFKAQLDKIYTNGIPVNDISITFGSNSRKLIDEEAALKILKPIADFLNAYPETKINISGNTDLNSPRSTTIKSDNEDITIQQLMDGRSQTLNNILTDKLKVNPTQVNTTPGTQGADRNGNIKVVQQKPVPVNETK